MASLYELTNAAVELEEMLMSGNIDETTYKYTIEGLDIETKIENICKIIRNLTAEAEMYKAEKDRLAERQKTAENGIKRLKESLLNYMLLTNQSKVKQGVFSVRVGSTEKVKVVEQDKIPKEFLIMQEPKIDLAGIKKAIKEGGEFEGVTIENSNHVRIR